MLLENLKALILAGNQALQDTCGLVVNQESVKQVRHGSVDFPTLGVVEITRGTLQKIYLGCNSDLCTVLTSFERPDSSENGVNLLLEEFKKKLILEMGGRNPKGQIGGLEIGSHTLFTRGVRTFGFQLDTDLGQLFLLAEVPSRLEFEQARGSDFLESMISSFLPRDWMHRDQIESSSLIDNFLVFLRKTEGDVELEFPLGDDEFTINSGILLETTKVDGKRVLKMSVDLSHPSDPDPQVGDHVIAQFGLRDRSIKFVLPFVGRSSYSVAGEAALDCVLFDLPEALTLVQRRKAFRINVNSKIPVEIEDLNKKNDPFSPDFGLETEPLFKGHLVDLSFSGARITSEQEFPKLTEGSRVLCRLFFPDRPSGLDVQGIIRRTTSAMVGRDTTRDEVGIEFLITPSMDRMAIEAIRQFVLSEQRNWLASRIHITS